MEKHIQPEQKKKKICTVKYIASTERVTPPVTLFGSVLYCSATSHFTYNLPQFWWHVIVDEPIQFRPADMPASSSGIPATYLPFTWEDDAYHLLAELLRSIVVSAYDLGIPRP